MLVTNVNELVPSLFAELELSESFFDRAPCYRHQELRDRFFDIFPWCEESIRDTYILSGEDVLVLYTYGGLKLIFDETFDGFRCTITRPFTFKTKEDEREFLIYHPKWKEVYEMANNPKTEKLYKEFLENFPKFEKMVKRYYSRGENGIVIYTTTGGKFVFEKTNDGFSLRAE